MSYVSPGRDNMGRYDPVSQPQKNEPDTFAPPPPTYYNGPVAAASGGFPSRSKFDPRGWSLRKKILAGLAVAIVIVVVIVGPYEGVKQNRYPNYYPLKYSLKDTYQGANFFDNFEYWSAPDPAQGFVQYVLAVSLNR